ncbi:hypothetical protein FBQ95_14820 [Chloroflexi bacterium CFX3]|nr:hypothetical protein [Chloroflexi bacterium CFX3]
MRQPYWARALRRFPMLDARHPVALRDAHFMPDAMPKWVRRFTNFWALVGFAALIHGGLFFFAVLFYHMPNTALVPLMAPFLTPFGTPIILVIMHSVLYWALLIGIANQMTYSFGRELESQTWRVLRLTPYVADELAITKVLTVGRTWFGLLRVLFALRFSALLVLPVAFAAQRNREISLIGSFDLLSVIMFLLQPFTEAFMVAGVSLLIAVLVRQALWAKLYAYTALVLGVCGLNALCSLWLTFNSPIGVLASLLVPFGHWTPLVVAAFPPSATAVYAQQTAVLALTVIGLPVLIGGVAFSVGVRRLRQLT